MKQKRLLFLLALLMTAATGTWAQDAKHLIEVSSSGGKDAKTMEQALPYTTTVGELYNAATGDDLGSYLLSVPLQNIGSTNTSAVSVGALDGASTPVTVKADGKATVVIRFDGGYTKGIFVNVVPPLYVTMKDGTQDADKWTAKVGEGEAQALPIGGLKGDGTETVTLKYNGRLKVKSVTATSDAKPVWDGDLSKLTAESTAEFATATNGMTISGTLAANVKVSIADKATVTLDGVTINGVTNVSNYMWAGLNCLGDATIILKDGTTNTVKGFHSDYPGIHVPENKTLTIEGSGSLTASSNGGGCGIGGGYGIDCGNIVIAGGTITATGGDYYAAGIGGGFYAGCGTISITGGTINATGGEEAAGIGGGQQGSCGNISITNGVTSVTATKGDNADYSIGAGAGVVSSCGTVTIGCSLDGGGNPIGGTKYWENNAAVGDGATYLAQATIVYPAPAGLTLDLATVTEDTTVEDGYTVTGALAEGVNVKISIAAEATVTLDGVTINGVDDDSYEWAGITCLGNATIILSGTNTVKGFYEEYPGIHVPQNNTLTIQGSGSLTASSNGWGAGIGGGYEINCGNIVIADGTITANGGMNAAGIGGSGYGSCGTIIITGGTITATGGEYGAGIGSGAGSSCGTISITNGVTSVTATKGDGANHSIGAGFEGSCGTVTIGCTLDTNGNPVGGTKYWENNAAVGDGDTYLAQAKIVYPAPAGLTLDLATVTEDTTVEDGYTVTGALAEGVNVKVSIAAGATVTLDGVTIDGVHNDSYKWAGITCLGDATIILSGTNTVKGFFESYPGIYVPVDKTLTFQGSGSLTASSSGNGCGIGAGNNGTNCGNIVIADGTITANGSDGAAGIGSGMMGSCGNISITGGTINATGGYQAAGIGSGAFGSCGNVTITNGVTSVTATKGDNADYSIGAGLAGSCAMVTIGCSLDSYGNIISGTGSTGQISTSPYTYQPSN